MIRRPGIFALLVLVCGQWALAVPAVAQAPLTLTAAIARARSANPDAGSAAAAEREAAQRLVQARAGYLPKIEVTESWQRGNQPVFVFGSLLAQRRFTAADFALGALNQPDALDNFRTSAMVEQSLFGGPTRADVSLARLGQDRAGIRRIVIDHDLAGSVTDAYGRVIAGAAEARAAAAAAEAARADRVLAGDRRDAGLATDADVLQLDLYVSRALAQQIRATTDERIARAQLNQLMGEPLDITFAVGLDPAAATELTNLAVLEAEALENRPEVQLAILEERVAGATQASARAAFLPQVVAQGGWELNGGTWNARSTSWVVGAEARLNVFRGFADKARLAEAREQVTRRALERQQVEAAARLAVHVAVARLDEARAGEAVGRAAVEQARESRRITRDRYEAGLADVSSLLRAAEGVVQAETQQTAAQVAILNATAALARALGRR